MVLGREECVYGSMQSHELLVGYSLTSLTHTRWSQPQSCRDIIHTLKRQVALFGGHERVEYYCRIGTWKLEQF